MAEIQDRKKAAYDRYRAKSRIGARLPSYEEFQQAFSTLKPFDEIGSVYGLNKEITSVIFEKFFSSPKIPSGRARRKLRTAVHQKASLDQMWIAWEERFSAVFQEAEEHGYYPEPMMRNGRPSLLFFWLGNLLARFSLVGACERHYRVHYKMENADLLVVQTREKNGHGFYLFPARDLSGRNQVCIPVHPNSWYHKHVRGLNPRKFKDRWDLATDFSKTG